MDTPLFSQEYHNATTIHPIGVGAMVVLGLLILVLPRRYAVWPMIVMACFVPAAQRIVIATLDFDSLRIMVAAGWLRLLLRNELRLTWNRLDMLLILWATIRTVAPATQGMGTAIVIGQVGRAFDAIGMYFLFRCLIRDWEDVRSVIKGITLISIPVAIAFAYEALTGRNPFSVFGGISEMTGMRGDRTRCQGAFAHPILAGCFWASALPLVAAQLRRPRGRVLALASLAAIGLIIIACASSTPLAAAILAGLGSIAFVARYHMRLVRWSILVTLLLLSLILNNPVWHLLARIDFASGSTGWHRYKLIDAAIEHADEWFLIGSNRGSLHWGYGLHDITNDYIVQGMQGGILQLLLFIAIIVVSFQSVGRLWRSVRNEREKLWLAWALGVCLFTHALSFIGVTYFGQIILIWYLTLAMISSLAQGPAKRKVRAVVKHEEPRWVPGVQVAAR